MAKITTGCLKCTGHTERFVYTSLLLDFILKTTVQSLHKYIQGDSLARDTKLLSNAEHRQMQVTGRVQYIARGGGPCCFPSFPVCVYKFSSHYLNNIIFIDNSLGPLARESPCIFERLRGSRFK